MSNYRDQLETYLKTLDITVKGMVNGVADVGGTDLPVRNRVRSWDVDNYIIYDMVNPETAHWSFLDANNPIDQDANEGDSYDVVFCLELAEYIWNPVQLVRNLAELTNSGGILYATFPFLYPIHEPKQADSLRYTADAIGKLLGEVGFKILKMIPRTMTPEGFDLYKRFLKAEGMHASKHSRHDILGWIVEAQKAP